MNWPITHEDISVTLINYQGDDTQICDAARVSFNKDDMQLDNFEEQYIRDVRLLNYLARHGHWSPFAHNSVTIRVTAPIFLARQLVKHQVGGVWNEVSRRYIDSTPTFYIPDSLHWRPTHSKQGSGQALETVQYRTRRSQMVQMCSNALETYIDMINNNIAPEEARMILPLNTNTSWYWTGSLMFFYRVYKQRHDSHAQLAAQEFASKLKDIVEPLFPCAWDALEKADE